MRRSPRSLSANQATTSRVKPSISRRKSSASLLAALDAVEALLPAAGQLGPGEQVVAEHLHEPDALLGGAQAAALALDVLRVDQPLDGGGAGGRGADAGVLHRLGGLVVVHQLAGGLHGAQERALRVAGGRLGLLGQRLGLGAARPASPTASCGSDCSASSSPLPVGRRRRVGQALLAVGRAPAGLDQHLAAGAEQVLADARLDDGALEARGGVEDRQEAARDHVVDAALVAGQPGEVVVALGGDDGVVVRDLRVVDHAAQGQAVEARARSGPASAYSGAAAPTPLTTHLSWPAMSPDR